MSEAILATFSDFKTVKTRSTAQLIFEIPIDQADHALKMLGGIPQPAEERWCGIALAPKERKEKSWKELGEAIKPPKRAFRDMPLSQQAALRCHDMGQFYDFLMERNPQLSDFVSWDAAQEVRDICGVSSRSELDTNDLAAAKWRKLEADFQAYLTTERYSGQIK